MKNLKTPTVKTKLSFRSFKSNISNFVAFSATLMFIFVNCANAQNSMINLHPNNTAGYVSWIDGGDSIRYWRVDVLERVAGPNNTFTEQKVWQHEEWRNNYVYIPQEFRPLNVMNRYAIKLIGFGSSTNILVEEDIVPFIGDEPMITFVEACWLMCNGTNYAWKVQQLIPDNGGGYKCQLMEASFIGESGWHIPFYEYMTIESYDILISNSTTFQQIYGFTLNPTTLNSTYWVNLIPNTLNGPTYIDKNGNILSPVLHPWIRVVKKGLGQWNALSYNETFTNMLADPQDFCVNATTWQYASAIMNSYTTPTLDPALTCHPQPYPNISATSWGGDMSECFDVFDPEECCETGSVIQNWLECVGDITPPGDGGGTYNEGLPWANINQFTLSKLDINSFQLIMQKSQSDLFDANGNFVPFSIELPAGLYQITAAISQSSNVIPTSFFELKEPIEWDLSLSTMFDHTIFPVPHVDDQFNINMQAFVNLKVGYELYDFRGNLIYSNTYNLEQGHNENHTIIPDKPIPTGILINRFIFEDGSELTETTLRQ